MGGGGGCTGEAEGGGVEGLAEAAWLAEHGVGAGLAFGGVGGGDGVDDGLGFFVADFWGGGEGGLV